MSYQIVYSSEVASKDIPKLSTKAKQLIRVSIQNRLAEQPEKYGVPLRKTLKSYFKLRVSDYRVIFRIEKNTVKVFMIGHRSTVYEKIISRLKRS